MATTSRSVAARFIGLVVSMLLFVGMQVFGALPRAAAADPDTGTITGTVLDAGGHGLTGVTVSTSGVPAVSATTSGDGTYVMVAPVGTYTLTATTSGYAPRTSAAIDVALNATVDLINFTLPKYATATGTISDGSGAGIGDVDVKFYDATSSSTIPVATTTSAVNGIFQLAELLPGSYKVEYDAARVAFMTRWYNNATTRDLATIVPVADGASIALSTTLVKASTISGRVIDKASGSGIAGATVVSYRNNAGVAGVVTDAAGAYELKVAAADQYTLVAYAPNHVTTWLGNAEHQVNATYLALLNSDTRTGVDITLDTGGAISGSMIPGNVSFSYVTASLLGDSYYGSINTTDGTYTIANLPPGDYAVGFHANGYFPQSFATPVPVTRNLTTPGVSATLTQIGGGGGTTGTCTMAGKATDLSGNGLPGVLVTGSQGSTTTSADGSYSLTVIQFGTVGFSLAGHVPASTYVSCSNPVMQADVELSRIVTISGTVTVVGVPKAGVPVVANGLKGTYKATTTDANGVYTFTDLAEDNYAISASWIDAGSIVYPPVYYGGATTLGDASYLPAAEASVLTGIDINLGKAGAISGNVRMADGSLATGARVGITGNGFDRTVTVEPNGDYSVGGLPVGTFTVTAYLYQWATSSIPITLASGESVTNRDLVLGDGFTVQGIASRGANLANHTVYLARGTQLESTITDSNGAFAFHGVPAGSYTLGVEIGSGSVFWLGGTYDLKRASALTVTANTVQDLVVPAMSTVDVTVKDLGGVTLTSAVGFVIVLDAHGAYVDQVLVVGGHASLPLWLGDFTLQTALSGYPTATSTITVDQAPADTASISQPAGSTLNLQLDTGHTATAVSVIARNVATGLTATGGVPMDGLASGTYKVAYYPLDSDYNVCGPLVWYGGTGFVSAEAVDLLENGETVIFVTPNCTVAPAGHDIAVQLQIPAGVEISPTDPIRVDLFDETGETGAWQPVYADAAGKATFANVQPGTYVVEADGSSYGLLSAPITVVVAATGVAAYLPMVLGGQVTGRVVDGFSHLVRASVTLTSATHSYQRGTDTGVFTLIGVEAGDYTLTATPAAPYAPVTLAHVPLAPGQILDVGTLTTALGGRITGHLPSLSGGYYVTIDAVNAAGAVVATTQGTLGNDYALWGVPAGTVRLRFSGDGLVTRWWNGSTTLADATPIPVVAGQVVSGISPDLSTIVVQTVTITGHVTGLVGAVAGTIVSAVSGGETFDAAPAAADGSYTLTVPVNRTYTVQATQCIGITIGEFIQCVDTLSSDSRTVTLQTTPVGGVDLSFGGGLLAFSAAEPTVAGDLVSGQTLTVTLGTWTPLPEATTYQWYADGTEIPAATGTTLVLTPDLIGKHISVLVTGTKSGYATTSRTSTPTAAVTGVPVVAGQPTFSGSPVVGTEITVNPGTWLPADATLSYAWISGATLLQVTGTAYTPTAADAGKVLSVVVTGSKDGQSTSVTITSDHVQLGTLTSGTVSISGTATLGSDLSATVGIPWGPAPVLVTYQWLRDGSPILDATATTYTVVAADLNAALSVTATGTKDGYVDAPVTSAPVTVGLLTMPTATVTVPSTATVGQTVTPFVTGWPTGTAVVIHWLRNGTEFTTGPSYVVTPTDAGAILTVTATGTLAGYNDGLAYAMLGTVQPGSITGTVTVAGSPVVGTTVTASATWTPALVPGTTYTWQRGSTVVGAGASYIVDPADFGQTLTVTATSAEAVTGYTVTPASATIGALPGTITGSVSINGSVAVGQTLTPVAAWAPGSATASYTWLRDGVLAGTGGMYTVTLADAGHTIAVQAVVSATGYTTATLTSGTVSVPIVAGSVAISPTPTVDVPSAAVVSGWATGSTFAYSWQVDGTPVSTSASYTPSASDAGKTLLLTVTATKAGYGSASGSASATVADGAITGGAATITGTLAVGSSLTASSAGWTPTGVSVSYAWFRDGLAIGVTGDTYVPALSDVGHTFSVAATANAAGYFSRTVTSAPTGQVPPVAMTPGQVTISGTAEVGSTLTAASTGWSPSDATVVFQWLRNGAVISGATTATYVPSLADVGATISVRGTASAPGYVTTSVTSAPTTAVPPVALTPGTVTITGSPAVGSTLTANPGTWSPAGATFTYQWLRGGSAISGATGSTYAVGLADVAAKLSVTVTGSLAGFTPTSATSGETAAVPQPSVVAGTVTITGTAAIGATLTANPGTWSPADTTLAYQWLRGGVAIAGATTATYMPVTADLGLRLSVSVTGTRTGYTSATAVSAQTAIVSQQAVVAGTVTITGTPYALSTLTANPGTWSPAGVRLSYQWLRDGAPIAGATGQTYTIPLIDVGHRLSVSVTGNRFGYVSATAFSAPTAAIQQQRVVAGAVTITGTPMVTSTLVAHPGAWTPTNARLSYQWLRDGIAIVGATDQGYTLTVADTGHTLTVSVTGTRFGYLPATAVSAPTAPVQAAHVVAGTVTITGTATVDNRLTAHAGAWTPNNANLSYQWLRDGAPIAGATGTRYTVVLADEGHALSVRVTGTRTGFVSATATSAPTAVVPAAQVLAGNVTIQGRAVQGSFLLAQTGSWSQNVSLSYQWLRDGVALPAARRWYYQVTSQDVGHVLTVVVTGTEPGYLPVSVTSTPTATVR